MLSSCYHIIAPDLRGHGESAKTKHGYHVARLAMDLQNLLTHLALQDKASIRCIAGSLGCSILWSYAELFTPDVFSHMVWVDQSPMQDLSLDDPQSWGPGYANRGMNSEAAVKGLFAELSSNPNNAYLGTINACLAYRSHPVPSEAISRETRKDDEAFFLAEAQKGDPMWYAQLMKDHTSLDWRDVIKASFGRPQNHTKILVVASSRSGCFPAEGPMEAVNLANEKAPRGEGRVEGTVVDWGGHWCFWEDAEKFHALVESFLQK